MSQHRRAQLMQPGERKLHLGLHTSGARHSIPAMIDDAAGWGARALLREFVEFWERLLIEGDFTAGCPVVAAATACPDDDPTLSVGAGVILGRWCTALTARLSPMGSKKPMPRRWR